MLDWPWLIRLSPEVQFKVGIKATLILDSLLCGSLRSPRNVVYSANLMHVIVPFQDPDIRILDKLCSIGWCAMNSNINILHAVIYIVDLSSMLIYIIAFLAMYTSLKARYRQLGPVTSNIRCTAGVVTCKCIFDNILEILFRVYLLTLLSIKAANLRYTSFCLYLFLFILPTNLIYSYIILFFK